MEAMALLQPADSLSLLAVMHWRRSGPVLSAQNFAMSSLQAAIIGPRGPDMAPPGPDMAPPGPAMAPPAGWARTRPAEPARTAPAKSNVAIFIRRFLCLSCCSLPGGTMPPG